MANLLNQVPTLLGVVLGALGAMLTAIVTDRGRWRREQASRWDESRLEAYMTFAGSLKEIHSLAYRLAASQRPGMTTQPIDRELGLEMLATANVRRTTAWEAVLLLGDAATVDAARRWREAVWAVEVLARNVAGREAEWEPAVEVVDHARDGFYLAARRSLGVSGGSVAQLPSLQQRRRLRDQRPRSATP